MPAVFDASAVLAIYFDEPGGELVAPIVFGSFLSAVNYSEVVSKAMDRGDELEVACRKLSRLGLIVMPFDEQLAVQVAALRPATKPFGLSVGDRACLALALREGVPAVTADRSWKELALGIEVLLIR